MELNLDDIEEIEEYADGIWKHPDDILIRSLPLSEMARDLHLQIQTQLLIYIAKKLEKSI